jgi:hypothetical protein
VLITAAVRMNAHFRMANLVCDFQTAAIWMDMMLPQMCNFHNGQISG